MKQEQSPHYERGRQFGWKLGTLVQRTVRDSFQDRLPGLAAELAFYMVLSLPPFLLVMLGALSLTGGLFGPEVVVEVKAEILGFAATFLTTGTLTDIVEPAVDQLFSQGRADILTFGAVLALWSASRASRVVIRVVTIAYDLEDGRSAVRRAALALLLTVAGVAAAVVLLPLLVVGPQAGAALAERFGLAKLFGTLWRALWGPAVVLIGISLLAGTYHVVAPWKTAWRRDLPGAVLALAIWLLGSLGLRWYAVRFIEANSAYSVLAAPFVVLLWVYVTAVALLVGAELNAEIEKLWPSRLPPADVL